MISAPLLGRVNGEDTRTTPVQIWLEAHRSSAAPGKGQGTLMAGMGETNVTVMKF
jgi:hypothetical protein